MPQSPALQLKPPPLSLERLNDRSTNQWTPHQRALEASSNPPRKTQPLSEKQRELVAQNIGLVGVHLHHHARKLRAGRHLGVWTDLFQEGCIGLIRAARTYPEGCAIPFAAYALRRIHKTISRAVRKDRARFIFLLDADRQYDFPPDHGDRSPVRKTGKHPRGNLFACANEDQDTALEEALFKRVHNKLQSAARKSLAQIRTQIPSARKRRLARLIVHHRLLIADSRWKLALREVARLTRFSPARVLKCEKRLYGMVRRVLESDAEFNKLQTARRFRPPRTEEIAKN